jgi:Protein of unknown function (DUF3352)
MKKVLFIVALLLGGAGGFYLFSPRAPHGTRAAQLLPENTLFFAHLPNLPQTRQRWKATALAQLLEEPKVQAFLEKPRAKTALLSALDARLAQIERIDPGEVFLAVTSLEGPIAQCVAGFSFSGNRSEVKALLAQPRAALQRLHPAGKSDLLTYHGTEIEIFSEKTTTVAAAFRDRWLLVANDLKLLEQTLDRFDLKPGAPSKNLAGSPIFASATQPIPPDRDVLLFTQLEEIKARLNALWVASGKALAESPWSDWGDVRAVAAATKLDGPHFRDSIFVFSPGAAPSNALPRRSLGLTSFNTLFYYAMNLPEQLSLPDSLAISSLILPDLGDIQKSLTAHGVGPGDFGKAFGPELGVMAEWPEKASKPSLVLALEVRDAAKAQILTKALTASTSRFSWSTTDHPGVTLYSAQSETLAAPTLALNGDYLLLGLNSETVLSALEHSKSGLANLSSSPPFVGASRSIGTPTGSYGYIDLRGFVERSYDTFRPFIVMSLALSPEAGQYLDGGKLPGTEILAKHLAPIVFSQSRTKDGTLIESTGTITLNQALLALAAGSISTALPELLKTVQSTGLDPAHLLQNAPEPSSDAPSPKSLPASAP